MAVETAEATIQGSGQELANNVIAQQTYDKNRAALEGIADAAALNASAASILSLLTSIAAHTKAKQPAIKYDDRKGPLIVNQNNELASPGNPSSPPAKPPTGNDLSSPQDPGLPKESPPARPNSGTSPDSQGNPYRNTDGTLILPDNWPKPKSEAETEALRNFLRLANNVELADQTYNQIPDAHGGKVIGTDAARELFPEYATREGKIQFTDITTIPASIYAKDRIWREINSPRNRTGLYFTAGGVGAGKSSILKEATLGQYDLIFDGTLRDQKWASETFHQALNQGWDIDVAYIQRPIGQVAEGVIVRANTTGRTFSLRNLFNSHRDAQKAILRLYKEFEKDSRVGFDIYYSSGVDKNSKSTTIDKSQIDVGGKLNYFNKHDDGREAQTAEDREQKSGSGSNETSSRRAVSDAFERAVRSGKFEDRILRRLASKDPKLVRILADHGRGPSSEIDQPGQSAYDRVINTHTATLGERLADQSRTFGVAAQATDYRGGEETGAGASAPGSGRNLAAWAEEHGKIVPESQFKEFSFVSDSTSEHAVYYRASDDRAVKRTRELYYGQVPALSDGELISENASPSDYLRRMSLQMAVFHTDFRLEGVTIPKESLFLDDPADAPYIVVSQPWIESKGTVDFRDVDRYLSGEGFVPMPKSFYGWVRPADGVVILDASPDNFIKSETGLVPIDLQMNAFTFEQLRELGFKK